MKKPKPTLIECPSCKATGFTAWANYKTMCGRCSGRGWLIAPPLGSTR